MANELTVAGDTPLPDKQDELFCQLLINGGERYAGNLLECYSYTHKKRDEVAARSLLQRKDVSARVQRLEDESQVESLLIKRYATSTLKRIIDETSTAKYEDANGTVLSPAPLRAVAVNATRLLMDIHKKKEKGVSGSVNISNNEGGGITFNVVVPNARPKELE